MQALDRSSKTVDWTDPPDRLRLAVRVELEADGSRIAVALKADPPVQTDVRHQAFEGEALRCLSV